MSNSRETMFALGELITATRALADVLADTAQRLHEDLGLSVPERSLLLDLRKSGPLTVPALARHRGVSRQFIQVTANPLLAEGLLEHRENPAHRRSKLLALTPTGLSLLREVMKREGAFLRDLADSLPSLDVHQAAETMDEVLRVMAAD